MCTEGFVSRILWLNFKFFSNCFSGFILAGTIGRVMHYRTIIKVSNVENFLTRGFTVRHMLQCICSCKLMSETRNVHHFMKYINLEYIIALKSTAQCYPVSCRFISYLWSLKISNFIILEKLNSCLLFRCCWNPLNIFILIVPLRNTFNNSFQKVLLHILALFSRPIKS